MFSNAIVAGLVPATLLPSIVPALIQRPAADSEQQSVRNPKARATTVLVLCYVSVVPMRRRSFLSAMTSAALGLGVCGIGPARAGGRVQIAVAHDAPGQ